MCRAAFIHPFHFDRIRVPWVMVVGLLRREEEKAICLWGAGSRKAWRRRGRPASRQARMGSVATMFSCARGVGTGTRMRGRGWGKERVVWGRERGGLSMKLELDMLLLLLIKRDKKLGKHCIEYESIACGCLVKGVACRRAP